MSQTSQIGKHRNHLRKITHFTLIELLMVPARVSDSMLCKMMRNER